MIPPTYECATSVAFRNAVQALGISYDEAAKKVGVSRATLSKLLSGRPLSTPMLQKMLAGLPREHSRQVLIGHLLDEIKRAGASTEDFTITERTRHAYLLEHAAKLLSQDGNRALDLVKLIESWQTTEKSQPTEPDATVVRMARPTRELID